MSFDPELEAFKTQIDLRQYAASLGFERDKIKSSRCSAFMRRGDDKIIIKLDAADGHFVYFTIHGDRDNGSIIDFAMRRKSMNLGEVRKELRPWIGRPSQPLPELPKLELSRKDRGLVEAEFEAAGIALRHPYLEGERKLPASLLSSPRFKGRVSIDERGNALFPHADQDGLCGFEKKNHSYTSFARGGEKALWFSSCRTGDQFLIFCESGIEALSHALLFRNAKARYASIRRARSAQRSLAPRSVRQVPNSDWMRAARARLLG